MISFLFACLYEDQTLTHLKRLVAHFKKIPCETVSLDEYFPKEKPFSYCFKDPLLKEERCLDFHLKEEQIIVDQILNRFKYKGCLDKNKNKFNALFQRGCFYEIKKDFLEVVHNNKKEVFVKKRNFFKSFYGNTPYRIELLKKLNKNSLSVKGFHELKNLVKNRLIHGALCEEYLTHFQVLSLNTCKPSYFIVASINEDKIELKLSSSQERVEVAFENLYMAIKKFTDLYKLGSVWPFEAWNE